MPQPLTVALGRTPLTAKLFEGSVADPDLPLDLPAIPVISRAFAPMVRDAAYPVSELALATFLMAKAAGAPLVLLPCMLFARFQESALLCPAASPIRAPEDLAGRRIGVRAYSQTTGMWLRGVLQERHAIAADAMAWVTFEDAHVAGVQDPPWTERAPPGTSLDQLLASSAIDAAIFGNDLPQGGYRTVFDVAAAEAAFRAQHGFVPVNHVLVARADTARDRTADLVRLLSLLGRSGAAVGSRAALAPALSLAARYSAQQGLTDRELDLPLIWQGTPDRIA